MKGRFLFVLCSLVLLVTPAAAEDEVLLGLYYDRAHDGHGFELHKSGDVYVLYFYTYEGSGDPLWLLGVGTMDSGVISGQLQRYTYDENADPRATADPGFSGRFRLDVTRGLDSESCNRDGISRNDAQQVSEFYFTIGEDSEIWCTEFLPVGDQHNEDPYYGGIWFAGEEDSGYGFTMSHQGGNTTALVYYYDSEGDPRWALGTGPDSGGVIELVNYLGYSPFALPLSLEATPAGTIDLDWGGGTPGEGRDKAILDLAFPRPPFGDFEREFTLRRLSDGEAIGLFGVDVRLSDLAEYALVWELDPQQVYNFQTDELEYRWRTTDDVWRTQDFGVPFAERMVNSLTDNQQGEPKVATAGDGSYAVVWEEDTGGDGLFDVYLRVFNGLGQSVWGPVRVNDTAGQHRDPGVAMAFDGKFVVVWSADDENDQLSEIAYRGYNADGSIRLERGRVNGSTIGHQIQPAVAMADDGSFVVVWADDRKPEQLNDIYMRGFSANGEERFSERIVNTTLSGPQDQPAIAMAANGEFAVSWTDDDDNDFRTNILVRAFTASGNQRMELFQANGRAEGRNQRHNSALAIAPDTGYITVVWSDLAGVFVRSFGLNGLPLHYDVPVEENPRIEASTATVGSISDGTTVVIWAQRVEGSRIFRLRGRTVNSEGVLGAELLITTGQVGSQDQPAISIR